LYAGRGFVASGELISYTSSALDAGRQCGVYTGRTPAVERLVELGELVASVASQPEVVRMVRLITECAEEHLRLAAAFYTAGRGNC
jgi:hypothetical protein